METKERVTQLRESESLSMRKFAERLGVSVSTVSLIEKGERELQTPLAKAICKEFDVSEEWLMTGKGEMRLPEDDVGAKLMAILIEDDSEVAKVMKRVYDRYINMDDSQKEAVDTSLILLQ